MINVVIDLCLYFLYLDPDYFQRWLRTVCSFTKPQDALHTLQVPDAVWAKTKFVQARQISKRNNNDRNLVEILYCRMSYRYSSTWRPRTPSSSATPNPPSQPSVTTGMRWSPVRTVTTFSHSATITPLTILNPSPVSSQPREVQNPNLSCLLLFHHINITLKLGTLGTTPPGSVLTALKSEI